MNTDQSEESEQVKILLPSGKISQSSKQPLTGRMQQVFLALDEASAEGVTTYAALINFVRIKTGKGCSKGWVAKWKKERALQLAQFSFVPELNAEVPQQVFALPSGDLPVLPTKYLGTDVCIAQTLDLGRQLKQSEGAVAWEEEAYSIQHKQLPASTDNPTESPLKKLTSSDLVKTVIGAKRLKVLSRLATVAAIGLSVILVGGGRSVNTDQVLQPSKISGQSNHTSPLNPAVPQKSNQAPKTFKFDLTISSPKDLKVREGDSIVAGEVLADRVEERSHLNTALQALELEYKQLVNKTIPVPPPPVQVPVIKSLPPISYDEEEAAITASAVAIRQAERAFQQQTQRLKTPPIEESAALRRASVEVANEERLVNNQKRKIDIVARLKDLPDAVMPHEQEVLKQKEASLKQVKADYELAQAKLSAATVAETEKLLQLGVALEKARAEQKVAIAKLQTKKDNRAYTEYEASITAAERAEQRNFASLSHLRQLQQADQQQRDRDYQLAQIQTKIATVKEKLSLVSVVTSPYSGTIKSIKVQKQTNNNLAVEITLAVSNNNRT